MTKKFTRNLALSAALLGMIASGAMAADPFVESSAHDWSGFYIGLHGGYGEFNVDGLYDVSAVDPGDTFVEDGEGPFSLSADGFIGGGQIGVNWQSGNLVVGLEADVSFADADDSVADNNDESVLSSETDFFGTLRGRAGWAMDNLLIYGTAGVAITDTDYTAFEISDASTGTLDFDGIGLALGGGAEYLFADNWSIKAEGLYLIFSDLEDASSVNSDSDTGDFAQFDDAWVARVGVNFYF